MFFQAPVVIFSIKPSKELNISDTNHYSLGLGRTRLFEIQIKSAWMEGLIGTKCSESGWHGSFQSGKKCGVIRIGYH